MNIRDAQETLDTDKVSPSELPRQLSTLPISPTLIQYANTLRPR